MHICSVSCAYLFIELCSDEDRMSRFQPNRNTEIFKNAYAISSSSLTELADIFRDRSVWVYALANTVIAYIIFVQLMHLTAQIAKARRPVGQHIYVYIQLDLICPS